MKRLLSVTLLIPLVLLFSIHAKAYADNITPSYLKSGVIETAYEPLSAEVVPDLDGAIASSTASPHAERALSFSRYLAFSPVSSHKETFTCRGPPQI